MSTFYELSEPTKSQPAGFGLDWTPADQPPAAGELVIKSTRCTVWYTVTEFPTGWDGRGFTLAKTKQFPAPKPGDDDGNYSCFLARNGQDRQCSCRGFAATGGCKHLLGLAALVENGWL